MTPTSAPSTREAKCAYHPERDARGACVECASPVCEECLVTVADRPLCRRCEEAIRRRVAAEIDAAAPAADQGEAAPPAPAPVAAASPADPGYAVPEASPADVAPEPPPARLLVGALLGIVVGLIGAFIYDKFVFYTNIQFGLVASFIGFAIGYAVLVGTGRGGLTPALVGALLALGAMIFSHYLLFNDMLARELGKDPAMARQFAERGTGGVPFTPRGIGFIFTRLDVMDWVFIAIGVYGGFITPYRAGSATTQE